MWYGPSKLNHNGLIERTFSFQDIFRIDGNPPAVVCSRGFLPSQDFTGYTGGAMYLSDVHIDIESFNVSDIHWINNVEINSYPPLKKGSWNNYI